MTELLMVPMVGVIVGLLLVAVVMNRGIKRSRGGVDSSGDAAGMTWLDGGSGIGSDCDSGADGGCDSGGGGDGGGGGGGD
jgi:hypothetical protein